MHFMNPLVLWLLTAVPLAGAAVVGLAWWRKNRLLSQYGEKRLVLRFSQIPRRGRYAFKAVCVFLSLGCLLVALARPYVNSTQAELPVGKIDVIALVDVSRSMAVQDYQSELKSAGDIYAGGTRLDMARYLLLTEVIPSLRYNRLGVVTYAGQALPSAFLTQDMPALSWVLGRSMTIQSAPGDGSSLVAAFNMAFFLFKLDSPPSHRRVIVLFSDGGNDDGMAAMAPIVAELKKQNVELVVVGLGSLTAHGIPVSQLSERDRYSSQSNGEYYQYNGQVVTSALDENSLRVLANVNGARYMRISTASDFHMVSMVGGEDVTYKQGHRELFFMPLLVGLLLFGLALISTRELKDDFKSVQSFKLPSITLRRK